jgi:hypothetical protein
MGIALRAWTEKQAHNRPPDLRGETQYVDHKGTRSGLNSDLSDFWDFADSFPAAGV